MKFRSGDIGSTNIPHIGLVAKSHPLLDILGDIEELNAAVGIIRQKYGYEELRNVQIVLIKMGLQITNKEAKLTEDDVNFLDLMISHMIKPQGHVLPSRPAEMHVARAICRRVERSVDKELLQDEAMFHLAIPYLNRLGDYFLHLARDLRLFYEVWHDTAKGVSDGKGQ